MEIAYSWSTCHSSPLGVACRLLWGGLNPAMNLAVCSIPPLIRSSLQLLPLLLLVNRPNYDMTHAVQLDHELLKVRQAAVHSLTPLMLPRIL